MKAIISMKLYVPVDVNIGYRSGQVDNTVLEVRSKEKGCSGTYENPSGE
jgi:hypothetical protein